jgi:plasmid stability protein
MEAEMRAILTAAVTEEPPPRASHTDVGSEPPGPHPDRRAHDLYHFRHLLLVILFSR